MLNTGSGCRILDQDAGYWIRMQDTGSGCWIQDQDAGYWIQDTCFGYRILEFKEIKDGLKRDKWFKFRKRRIEKERFKREEKDRFKRFKTGRIEY